MLWSRCAAQPWDRLGRSRSSSCRRRPLEPEGAVCDLPSAWLLATDEALVNEQLRSVGCHYFSDLINVAKHDQLSRHWSIAITYPTIPSADLVVNHRAPPGTLDVMNRETLWGELREIWRATERPFVVNAHAVEEAATFGCRMIAVSPHPGTIVFEERLPFLESSASLTELRSSHEVAAAAKRIRAALITTEQETPR